MCQSPRKRSLDEQSFSEYNRSSRIFRRNGYEVQVVSPQIYCFRGIDGSIRNRTCPTKIGRFFSLLMGKSRVCIDAGLDSLGTFFCCGGVVFFARGVFGKERVFVWFVDGEFVVELW
jgi:hypothetical protein